MNILHFADKVYKINTLNKYYRKIFISVSTRNSRNHEIANDTKFNKWQTLWPIYQFVNS